MASSVGFNQLEVEFHLNLHEIFLGNEFIPRLEILSEQLRIENQASEALL